MVSYTITTIIQILQEYISKCITAIPFLWYDRDGTIMTDNFFNRCAMLVPHNNYCQCFYFLHSANLYDFKNVKLAEIWMVDFILLGWRSTWWNYTNIYMETPSLPVKGRYRSAIIEISYFSGTLLDLYLFICKTLCYM